MSRLFHPLLMLIANASEHWLAKYVQYFKEELAILRVTRQFDAILESEGVKPKVLPVRSPNLNARCERIVQSIKQECLDNFLVFGQKHLNYLVREYVRYYNDKRAHSSRDFLPPSCADPPPENNTIVPEEIIRNERLGGLIKWYERAA